MRFLSMFSGIDAASAAWNPLGWEAAAFCEIEAFPSSVLAHHYPHVPNLGDVTKADFDAIGPIDLAVFGSPCQSFSVAGKRLGLDDDRGNLALLAGRIVYRKRPRWFVFENVPGLLSSDAGFDFGTLLAAFAGYPSGSVFQPPADGWGSSGVIVQADGQSYGLAWRVLDAQYFGVAQRRRRVFVVGYLGDWRRAAAVLFERHSLSGHPAPRREAGQRTAAVPGAGAEIGCPAVSPALKARDHKGPSSDDDGDGAPLIAHTLKGEGFDGSEDGTGRGTPIVPVCFSSKDHGADALHDLSPTLRAGGHDGSHANAGVTPAIAFSIMPMNSGKDFKGRATDVAQPVMAAGPAGGNQGGDYIVQPSVAYAIQERAVCENPNAGPDGAGFRSDDAAYTLEARTVPQAVAHVSASPTLRAGGNATGGNRPQGTDADTAESLLTVGSAVRRLTPRECERLQGFPDDYTVVSHRGKLAADGPRYKALGNSMAVPCMAWIGQRIQAVEDLAKTLPVNDTAPQIKEQAA
jgi:DNA (cytosine-5)-methyltransferase 1